MKNIIVSALLVVFLVNNNLKAEISVKKYTNDLRQIITSPLRIKKSDVAALALVAGSAGALMIVDSNVRNYSMDSSHRNDILDGVFCFSEKFGDGFVTVPACGVFWLAGSGFKDDKLKKIGIMGVESFIFTGMITSAFKFLIGRNRPYAGNGPFHFNPFTFDNEKLSMPSGHSSTAFSLASVIAGNYNKWVDAGAYTLAGLTALSRVYHDKHWLSDVFLGAVIGTAVGRAVVKLNEPENKNRIAFVPWLDLGRKSCGMNLFYGI